jgi:flagellar motor protein MotB
MNRLSAGLVMTLLSMTVLGCQSKVHDENVQLHHQNRELQEQLSDRDARLRQAPDPNQVSSLQQELAARDARIKELEGQLRAPTPGTNQPGLEGIDVTSDPRTGNVTVNLPGDILFDSGKATLRPNATATLNKVVAALKKDYSGKQIYVDGYTDSDPITKTKDQWEDNLDLSAARARTVAAYLTSQGMSERLVAARAMAATKPKQTKAASRRVEIVVITR